MNSVKANILERNLDEILKCIRDYFFVMFFYILQSKKLKVAIIKRNVLNPELS
jgi:hypothetical protein